MTNNNRIIITVTAIITKPTGTAIPTWSPISSAAVVGSELPSVVVPGGCVGVGEVCRVGGAIAVVVEGTVASVVLAVVIGQPVFTIRV